MRIGLIVVTLLLSPSALAYETYTTSSGAAPLRWFQAPGPFVRPATLPPTWTDEAMVADFEPAAAAWNAIACDGFLDPILELAEDAADTEVGYEPDGPNQNSIIPVTTEGAWLHGAEVRALTSITFDDQTGQIVDTDLEINLAGFGIAPGPDCTTLESLRIVFFHELGHTLGLDHSQEEGAQMQANATWCALSEDDEAGKCALYGGPPPEEPGTDTGTETGEETGTETGEETGTETGGTDDSGTDDTTDGADGDPGEDDTADGGDGPTADGDAGTEAAADTGTDAAPDASSGGGGNGGSSGCRPAAGTGASGLRLVFGVLVAALWIRRREAIIRR